MADHPASDVHSTHAMSALSSQFFTAATDLHGGGDGADVEALQTSHQPSDSATSSEKTSPRYGGGFHNDVNNYKRVSPEQHAAQLRKAIPVLRRTGGGGGGRRRGGRANKHKYAHQNNTTKPEVESKFWVPSQHSSTAHVRESYARERAAFRSEEVMGRVKIMEVLETAQQVELPSKILVCTYTRTYVRG